MDALTCRERETPAKAKLRRAKATAGATKRRRKLEAERIQILNNPDPGGVLPIKVSMREYELRTGVSHATLSRWIKEGKIKSEKKGGRRLIPYSEL